MQLYIKYHFPLPSGRLSSLFLQAVQHLHRAMGFPKFHIDMNIVQENNKAFCINTVKLALSIGTVITKASNTAVVYHTVLFLMLPSTAVTFIINIYWLDLRFAKEDLKYM